MLKDDKKRVVFVQNGDFRAADQRIKGGRGETYDAQAYSMNVVERIATKVALTAVVCINAEAQHDEILPTGVRSIGIDDIWKKKNPFNAVIAQLKDLMPTHLILRIPSNEIIVWSIQRNIQILPSFADSFTFRTGARGILDRLRVKRLAKALNHSSVRIVGNHNIAAAEALAKIGVRPEKILPWDWPRSPTPQDFPSKTAAGTKPKRLIFVGSVSEEKGVGDILRAMAADPDMGDGATLEVFGSGEIEDMRKLAAQLGIQARVHFGGRIPHADVTPAMHAADAVVVYSRHAYGEGLPGTIYLGLASRTPLVVSDHPMFTAYFEDRTDLVIAPERNPDALAAKLRELFSDAELYRSLSDNSSAAFNRIAHPVHWGDFVERWLHDTSEDRDWLDARTLPRWRSGQPPDL
ncbi:MAG: glycosyltransferase family 4 protein [Pseudomonadota bacterium]